MEIKNSVDEVLVGNDLGKSLKLSRCVVDKDFIDEYKKAENVVKFVFLNEEYFDLSTDSDVKEIHKFKSKYPGNSYVRVPLHIEKNEDGKYATKIVLAYTDDLTDGYAVISKLDIITLDETLKRAKKSERESYGFNLCVKELDKYNAILNGEVFYKTVTDKYGNIIQSEIIFGEKSKEDTIKTYVLI